MRSGEEGLAECVEFDLSGGGGLGEPVYSRGRIRIFPRRGISIGSRGRKG